jgi:hypothetical protein
MLHELPPPEAFFHSAEPPPVLEIFFVNTLSSAPPLNRALHAGQKVSLLFSLCVTGLWLKMLITIPKRETN